MVNFCSGFDCTSSSDVREDLSFHKFPLKEKERLQKWVHAVRRKDFKPSSSSTLCSLHFKETDFYSAVVSGKQMLKKSAVPSVFNFPNHLIPKIKERRILQREDTTTTTAFHNTENIEENNTSTCETDTKFVDIGIQTKLTGEELDRTLQDLRRDKKILQQKLMRRDKRVSSIREMLNLLKNNHLIGDTVEDIFKNQFDSSLPFALFQNEIANVNNASNHKSYSEEIREFCLTLHFYSPRAYEFIRQRSTLPDPSTIRRWLATRHCNPGILHEVIDYFKQKLKSETSNFLHVKDVALIYDAMSIREGFWPDKSGKVYGYCDLGGIAQTDNEELAKEALVFIIGSLNKKFKCPVAYFFINKINATVQSQLVLAVISVLYEAGITVRSLTSDGTTTNLKTYELLGCSLDHTNIQSSFHHPNEPLINIHCIVDPCHLMKICRNCMAELSLSHSGRMISFDYVKKLHEIQQIENLKFANKLSSLHIFYKNKKMSVPLAVQVLSSSVADALQFLQSYNNDFKNATATIEFIRIFDRLFDIMNARNIFGKGFKSPMKLSNQYVWEEIFENAKSYILQLKCEEKNILQHRRKTFALGFLINILSYKNLALDLLTRENEPLIYFLPYKTSQDHAEITFSCIRSAGGWNNNPSALQFKWNIRKMLYRNSVLPSKNANCQDLEDKEESISIGIFSLSHKKSIDVDKQVIVEELMDEEVLSFSYLDDNTFSHYQKNILYYIAGNASYKFIEKFPCSFCEDIILNTDIFSRDHNYSLIPVTDYICFTNFKNRGKLKFVSVFIFDIVLFTEKCYQEYSSNIKNNNFKKDITLKVQRQFMDRVKNVKPVHPVIDTCTLELHELKIVKFISSYYCTLRVHTQCKQLTQQKQGSKSSLRHKLNKLILFNHV